MTMNYAFSLWPNGAWENSRVGDLKREGSFAAGDRFASRSGNVVVRRNGAPVYTSAVVPVFPLVLDVTLSSLGASLTGAAMGTGPSDLPPVVIPPPPPPVVPPPGPVLPSGVVAAGAYTAVIERQPHGKPPVPVLGAAGSTTIDPVFLRRSAASRTASRARAR
jgi:hypothetical protein